MVGRRGRKPLEETLTKKQIDYLLTNFPNTANAELAKKLNINVASVSAFAKRHNVHKSAQYMRGVKRYCGITAQAHGWGRPFKKGHICVPTSDEANEIRKKHISDSLKKTFQRDRLRIKYGLPQLTKRRLVNVPHRIRLLKRRLMKRGYIIDDDKRIAYYNGGTRRSRVMEQRKAWYSFENVNDVNRTNDDEGFVPEPPPVNDFFMFT